jgi:hypothetical protein
MQAEYELSFDTKGRRFCYLCKISKKAKFMLDYEIDELIFKICRSCVIK